MKTNDAARPLHMVQLQLDAAALMRQVRDLNLGQRHEDLGYPVHAALAALFGQGTVQPFSIRGEARHQGVGSKPVVLGYSAQDRKALTEHAETYADPGFYQACEWPSLACKPMPRRWNAGRVLGFEVRICPVVRLASDLSTGQPAGGPRTYKKGSEMDVWLNRRLRDPQNGDVSISRQQAYRDWLQQRLGQVARLQSALLRRFRRVNLVRRKQDSERTARTLERPEAVLTGSLEILDPQGFSRLLAGGVGRHKAFGFGMLLLRAGSRDA
ncbi:MAG TPA: type I-E CRISPR-associated protein Cas6/Cse3/CasE [Acidobacteriota bacterium]|nr:type I-E CRISPR-associated protein Cas6/Cse3/CasE [Acidobacteriota bacterium]